MARHAFLGLGEAPARLAADAALGALAVGRRALAGQEPAHGHQPAHESHIHPSIPGHQAATHDGKHSQLDQPLFREEDTWAWVVFTAAFVVLIFFDNFVLNRTPEAMTFRKSCCFVVFWLFTACCFCFFVYVHRGTDDAFDWATGYLLEWMLSFDNLVVFHMVFEKFRTPNNLKHKPLFWGIVGAIVFRMIFFCVGEIAMHKFWWMHIIFALFLIYTGVKAAFTDDDDEDPQQNVVFVWLRGLLKNRLILVYDPDGRFFVRARVDPETGEPKINSMAAPDSPDDSPQHGPPMLSREDVFDTPQTGRSEADDGGEQKKQRKGEYQWRATLLVLVIICLELTDVIFAVDSVSAIIAQVPDLYLAYTACVFAMLGLRATFFVIDELVKLFSLLKYGVAITLIFIGVKLILKGHYHIPPVVVFVILLSVIAGSMILSVIYERWIKKGGDEDASDGPEESQGAAPPAAGEATGQR